MRRGTDSRQPLRPALHHPPRLRLLPRRMWRGLGFLRLRLRGVALYINIRIRLEYHLDG
jgi:hypothetical protein